MILLITNGKKIDSIEQMAEDDEDNDVGVTIIFEVNNEDKENPQVKVNLQVIGDDSSLSSLRATYSEDLE